MSHLRNGKQTSRVTLLMLLAFCWSSVSCQDSVNGSVGEEVLLPCTCNCSLPQASAYWRDKDDTAVLDIVESSEDHKYQGEKYRGRVFSFPDQYKNGNFSIIMKNLQKDDADTYECYIQTVGYRTNIELSVLDQPTPCGAAGLNHLQVLLLSAICLLLFF